MIERLFNLGFDVSFDEIKPFLTSLKSCSQLFRISGLDAVFEKWTGSFENYLLFLLSCRGVTSKGELLLEIAKFYKMEFSDSMCADICAQSFKVFSVRLESGLNFEHYLSNLEEYINSAHNIYEHPILTTLYEVFFMTMSHQTIEWFGIDPETVDLKYTFEKWRSSEDMLYKCSFLANLLTLSVKSLRYIKDLFDNDFTFYSDERVKQFSVLFFDIVEMRALNVNSRIEDYANYIAICDKIDEAIPIGEEILLTLPDKRSKEYARIRHNIITLKTFKKDYETKSEILKDRMAPFAVLLAGPSSVSKTMFMNIIFKYVSELLQLPHGDEYKYTRNGKTDFWSEFETSMWSIVLDDVAWQRPGSMPGGDPTVNEFLQICNNAVYVPDQAELERKGKIYVDAKLVMATTNNIEINTKAFFNCPLAPMRRFNLIISLEVKEEYRMPNSMMLDKDKANRLPLMDCWNIQLKNVVPNKGQRGMESFDLEDGPQFSSIQDFLLFLHDRCTQHFQQQESRSRQLDYLNDLVMCQNCNRLVPDYCSHCHTELQSGFKEKFKFKESRWGQIYSFILSYLAWSFFFFVFEIGILFHATCGIPFFRRIFFDAGWVHSPVVPAKRWPARYVQNVKKWCRYCAYKLGMKLARIYFSCYRRYINYYFWCKSNCDYFVYSCKARPWNWFFIRFLGLLISIGSLLLIYHRRNWHLWFSGSNSTKKKTSEDSDTESTTSDNSNLLVLEGAANSGHKPTPDLVAIVNHYKRDYQYLAPCEYPRVSKSWSKFTRDEIVKHLKSSLFHFHTGDEHSNIIGVCGSIYLTSNHALKTDVTMLEFTHTPESEGLGLNRTVRINPANYRANPGKDQTWVKVLGLPPRSSNFKRMLCPSIPTGVFNGFMIVKDQKGNLSTPSLRCIRVIDTPSIPGGQQLPTFGYKCLTYTVSENTQVGMCGSPIIAETPNGPLFLGIHMAHAVSAHAEDKWYGSLVIQDDFPDDLGITMECGNIIPGSKTITKNLSTVHFKSPVYYSPTGCLEVYGSIDGWRAEPTSKVTHTLLKDSLSRYGIKPSKGKPRMSGWRPKYKNFVPMCNTGTDIDLAILDKCISSYLDEVLPLVEDGKIHVVDTFTAINGAPGVCYVDGIPRNTSAGHPYHCSKSKLAMKAPTEEYPDGIMYNDEVMEQVDAIIDTYHEHRRYHPIFTCHLKDEPVSFEKIQKSKIRLFSGSPLAFSIVMRKYLLMFVKFMQENQYTCESAVGINADGYEWHTLYEYLTYFGENRLVAGDYSKFDKTMSPEIIQAAFKIIIAICKKAGYNTDDLLVLEGIALDIAFPTTNFFNDLVGLVGTNPSGHPLTVHINSIVNSLYLRYAYFQLNPARECRSFKRNVNLMTYGDDNIFNVSPSCNWFNHTTIADIMYIVGVGYTMADKESVSVPFIDISDATFLKRGWRWSELTRTYLAPIEETSIHNALTISIISPNITSEAHALSVMNSCLSLAFQFGYEYFSYLRKIFTEVIFELDLEVEHQNFPLFTFNQLLIRYKETCKNKEINLTD